MNLDVPLCTGAVIAICAIIQVSQPYLGNDSFGTQHDSKQNDTRTQMCSGQVNGQQTRSVLPRRTTAQIHCTVLAGGRLHCWLTSFSICDGSLERRSWLSNLSDLHECFLSWRLDTTSLPCVRQVCSVYLLYVVWPMNAQHVEHYRD